MERVTFLDAEPVVTAAGLILIGVFGSFATAGIITVKEIGLGLAIGCYSNDYRARLHGTFLDGLMGDRNWVMPNWLSDRSGVHEGLRRTACSSRPARLAL
jgi:uncharacterized membrane protein YdfJ with MMPL/SSD domain